MKTIFAAAALSLVLYGPAFAQGSNQGTPNTLHGSGDMMQDGPHASTESGAISNLPASERPAAKARLDYCRNQWNAMKMQGTTGGRSAQEFMVSCRNGK
jgi:hypothetical protein